MVSGEGGGERGPGRSVPQAARRRGRDPEGTRRRIVEATVALHEEVGPAATTVVAVAERAGVQRLTVYRHFPDERALLAGCSAHWREAHPLPDPSSWTRVPDPGRRVRVALEAVYGYFREGAPMLRRILRDEPDLPALADIMVPWHGWMREQAGALSAGWGGGEPGARRVRGLVAVALRFGTWEALEEAGFDPSGAAGVMAGAVRSGAALPAMAPHPEPPAHDPSPGALSDHRPDSALREE